MKGFISNLLLPFTKEITAEHPQRSKEVFLYSVFLFAGIVALLMSIYRWQGETPVLGLVDLLFALLCFVVVYFLHKHQERIELVSNIALWLSFTLFVVLYLYASETPVRVALFFPFIASVFYLKGPRQRLLWMLATIAVILAGYFLPFFDTGFNLANTLTMIVYLLAMFFVLVNFSVLIEHQTENLRESEQRFRTLFEEMPDPALLIINHEFTSANNAAARILGYDSVEQIPLSHPSKLSPEFQPDGEPSYKKAERYMDMADNAGVHRFEWIHTRKDGSQFPVEVTLASIVLHDAPVLYCLWRDISSRKHNEQLLLRNLDQGASMLRLSTETVTKSEAELGIFALQLIEQLTESELTCLYYLDGQGVDVCCWNQQQYDAKLLKNSGFWRDSLDSDNPEIRNELPPLQQTSSSELPALRRYISIPVFQEDKRTLVLVAANKNKDYDEHDLKALELIANHLWVLLQKKRTLNELELAAEVFRSSREGIMITNDDNRIISVNKAFIDMTGYQENELVGQSPSILKSDRHDALFFQQMWQKIHQQGQWQGEIWNRAKSGHVYPEWLSITAIRDTDTGVRRYIAIHSDISQYKAAEQKIHYLAHFDELTGLPNRTLLHDRVNMAMAAAARHNHKLALLFMDLDRFKNINDSLGHINGDKLLKALATRLSSEIRREDTLSRVGGDEFVAILANTDVKHAGQVAEKLLRLIASPFKVDKYELNITGSIGIALYPDNGSNFDELYTNADTALYGAKQGGKNRYQFFNKDMYEHANKVLNIENALRKALQNDEFCLHFQTQVDAQSGKIVGAEALLRWNHPEWGMMYPSDFIQIAEESGLIIDIGNWAMRKAIQQMAQWRAANLPINCMAVNVSLAQFRQKNLVEHVRSLLQEYQLDAEYLELEITESIAAQNYPEALDTVDQLHELGVKLSVDDFGTGYSSLSYLKRFRVHKLKIDQSFVRDLTGNDETDGLVIAIISMAKNLGFTTIAEGVETNKQLDILCRHQCDEIQGYLFSRPVTATEFEHLLRTETFLKPI